MQLPLSGALGALVVLDRAASTNDELLARAATSAEFTVVITTDQTAGRGRLGRVWSAPAGESLATSVLLRPVLPTGVPLPLDDYGWLPLLAGLAMTRAVRALLPDARVGLKWPNDVLVEGKKVCGILAELLGTRDAVVLGAGLNLTIAADRLPTPTSTSLALHGVPLEGDALIDAVLGGYLSALHEGYSEFLAAGGNAKASGLAAEVERACSTIGQEVRVLLPSGDEVVGTARGIDASGRLVIERASDAALQSVAAGDVTHLRYE